MRIILFLLVLTPLLAVGQWTETNLELTSTGTSYTKFQFAEHTWSGSHAIFFNAYKNITVGGSLASLGNSRYANNQLAYSGGAGAIMFFGNGGTMDFFISPAAGAEGKDTNVDWGTPKMRINRSGEVGIGTTDIDGYKLSVNGNVRATEVKVETYPWPDYVFSKDYHLPTLESIEEFVQSNGHLPEIPSAKEIEENGLQLGEMNRLLVKKIEELTLHLIKQNKESQQLKAKADNQNKKIEELTLHTIAQEKMIEELSIYPLLLKDKEERQGELEVKVEKLVMMLNELEKKINNDK